MRVVERLTVLAVVCCLMGLGAGAALAGDLKSEVASCFPAAPAGYQAEEEVSFDIDPGDDLLEYLRQNSEVRREYTGGQTIGVNILGNGLQAFINAANGMLPGCDTLKVAGRKASVFYDSAPGGCRRQQGGGWRSLLTTAGTHQRALCCPWPRSSTMTSWRPC